MTEDELRTLVRSAIAEQLGRQPAAEHDRAAAFAGRQPGHGVSFARFLMPSGPDGMCLIEPAVTCNHCGYCKSYGH